MDVDIITGTEAKQYPPQTRTMIFGSNRVLRRIEFPWLTLGRFMGATRHYSGDSYWRYLFALVHREKWHGPEDFLAKGYGLSGLFHTTITPGIVCVGHDATSLLRHRLITPEEAFFHTVNLAGTYFTEQQQMAKIDNWFADNNRMHTDRLMGIWKRMEPLPTRYRKEEEEWRVGLPPAIIVA